MTMELNRPGVDGLTGVVWALREWQRDEVPVQLHPGDLGWQWASGADATAAAVRTWSRDGQILAIGMLDGPDLVRLAFAPEAELDEELARRLVDDVSQPSRGVLPEGAVSVEARTGAAFRKLLSGNGWEPGEPWTPLQRDLSEPVEPFGVRVETIGPDRASVHRAVHRSAFGSERFTDERWHLMAAGLPYSDARSLVAFDDQDNAVASVTVWSAGPGRPGLLEPMGVHQDHRGHGYGRAISVAAAEALRDMGASSAIVATPSSNVGAVATYASAGFRKFPEVADLRRPA